MFSVYSSKLDIFSFIDEGKVHFNILYDFRDIYYTVDHYYILHYFMLKMYATWAFTYVNSITGC